MRRPMLTTLWTWLRRSPDDTAHSDRAPGWLVVVAYVGFPLLSLLVALWGLQVASVDQIVRAPLLNYDDGDTLLILPMVKDAVERGSHWRNDRMGAPGDFQLYDFPVVDHLHFGALWLVGVFTGSYITAFNVYFLLAYPLTTLTTLAVLRRFGFSLPAAGAAGLMYAFLYYHAGRCQAHYFLSAYWVIPLSMLLVLRTARGEPPLTEEADGSRRWALRRGGTLAAVVIAVLSGLGGAYYAFFTCALLGFAGVYGSVAVRSWKPVVSAASLIGVVFVVGVAAHAPTIVYQATHGRNGVPTRRLPAEAESYGLKIGHLLMPTPEHQWEQIGRFAAAYHEDGRPVPSENRLSPLGAIGSAGLIAVGVVFLLPGARRWPYGTLGALVVFGILFSTIGGLGALFNFFVTPQVRAYSRMSIFLGFLGLFAALRALDQWLPGRTAVRWAAFVAIAALGIADQTPRPWFRQSMAEARWLIAARFNSDATFFGEVEARVPGEMVFALPHVPYPESEPRARMSSAYRSAAGYLHTHTVRWSFGAMKARETDQWLAEVGADSVPVMTERLAARGFGAICLDTYGYTEADAKQVIKELTAVCGPPIARQEDDSRMLFDLRPVRARLVQAKGEVGLARRDEHDREAVRLMFRENFILVGRADVLGRVRGTGLLCNPSDRTRVVRLRFRHTWGEGLKADPKVLAITSDFGWTETILERNGEWSCRTFAVPPGDHRVEFRCPREYDWFNRFDSRVCYGLWDLELTEP